MVGTKMMVQGTWSKATAVVTRIKVTIFKRMLFPGPANWALLADPFNQGRCFCGYLLGFERILPASPSLPLHHLESFAMHPMQHGVVRLTQSFLPHFQGEKEQLSFDQTGWLRWLLLAKRELLSPVPYHCHRMPSLQQPPLISPSTVGSWDIQCIFFSFVSPSGVMLLSPCILNSAVNWPRRFTLTKLNNSTKIIPLCTFFN